MRGAALLIRWMLSLLLKFYKVVPFRLSLIVSANVFSQMFVLLSLLLPLKVIMLLGSEKMPSYAIDIFPGLDRDTLVMILVVMTVSFFVLHLLLEKVTSILTEKACSVLLKRNKKIVLFEGQDDVARAGFQRFAKVLAGAVFTLAASCALFYLYSAIAWLIAIYITVLLVLYFTLLAGDTYLSARVLKRHAASQWTASISNIGFFICFLFLVCDFLFLKPPGIVFAIAALLLSRQFFNKLSALAMDLLNLWGQKARVDVLFFHGKVWAPKDLGRMEQFWGLFNLMVRKKWLNDIAGEIQIQGLNIEASELIPVGLVNIVGLKVAKDNGDAWFVFKVFGDGRQSYAAREFELLSSAKGLPAPNLTHIAALGDYPVACYRIDDGRSPEAGEMPICSEYIIREIARYIPPETLVERYRRSKPMLWQRFDVQLIERVRMAVPAHRLAVVDRLLERRGLIADALSSLPLSLVLPEFGKDSVWFGVNQPPVLLNWAQWSLEPLGAGLYEREEILLEAANNLFERQSGEFQSICLAERAVRIASLVYIAEEKITKQRYSEALSHIIELLAVLDGNAATKLPAWHERYLALQQSPDRDEWVRSILSLVALTPGSAITVNWRQTRLTGTFLLQVVDSSAPEVIWIKVFAPNRYDIALSERRLLESYGCELNTRYINFLRDQLFHVLVFTTPRVRGISKSEYGEAVRSIKEMLLAVDSQGSDCVSGLIDVLPYNMKQSDLEKLYIAINWSGEQKLVDSLINRWEELRQKLAFNPLTIVVSDINPDAIFVSENSREKEYYLTSWVGWSLAPAGSGFDIADARTERFKLVHERVTQRRSSLANISIAKLELAALTYKFSHEIARARLSDALELVPQLLRVLDRCD